MKVRKKRHFFGWAWEEEVKGDMQSERGIGALRGILGVKGESI